MSIVLLTEHDESINNIKKSLNAVNVEREGNFYKTVHESTLKKEKLDPRFFQPYGTMGKCSSKPPSPSNFLKKRTGKPPMRPAEQMDPLYGHHGCWKEARIPRVPFRDDVIKEQDDKLKHKCENLIRKNIQKVLAMKPKCPGRVVVISRDGEKRPLKEGLEPKYIYSDLYGTLPKYLDKLIKKQERRIQKSIQKCAVQNQPLCTYVTRSNRERLLAGLKANWAELQCQYQLLPILTDTIPKKNRKSKLEADLKQLEKDIVLIERNPYLYIYDDSDALNQ